MSALDRLRGMYRTARPTCRLGGANSMAPNAHEANEAANYAACDEPACTNRRPETVLGLRYAPGLAHICSLSACG